MTTKKNKKGKPYKRITLAGFKEKLDAGFYPALKNARCAVTRATWGKTQKSLARKMVGERFGEGEEAPEKKASKKASNGVPDIGGAMIAFGVFCRNDGPEAQEFVDMLQFCHDNDMSIADVLDARTKAQAS